jgi:hypothetical protein
MSGITKKFRRRGSRTILLSAAMSAFVALGVASAVGAASPAIPTDQFELDGNPISQSGTDGVDWSSLFPNGADSGTWSAQGSLDEVFTADVFGVMDDQFATGSKDISPISGWEWKRAEPGDKVDIQNAFAATYDKGGDQLIYFGADRHANAGDAEIGFWFFRDTVQAVDDGTDPNLPFAGEHKIGDVFVEAEFTQGGEATTVQVYEWVGSGGSEGTLDLIDNSGTCGAIAADKYACGIVNDTAAAPYPACTPVNTLFDPPWAFTPKNYCDGLYDKGMFFEGAINLSALFRALATSHPEIPSFQAGPGCFSSFMAETSESQSVTENIADFALGDLDTCGSITVVKDAVPDDVQDFSFSGTSDQTTLIPSFSLDDDGTNTGADGDIKSSKKIDGLLPGLYSVSEGSVTGWTNTSATCTGGDSDDGDPATLHVDRGDNIVCTFVNTKTPRLTLTKKIVGGSGESFDVFDGGTTKIDNATSTAAAGTTVGPYDSTIGTHTITETFGDGTTAVPTANWTIAFSGDCNSSGQVTLAAGDSKSCTITNTRRTGKIELVKDFDSNSPAGAKVDLFIKQGGSAITGGTKLNAEDGQGTGEVTVPTGSFDLSETQVAGTPLSDYTTAVACIDQANGNAAVSLTGVGGDNRTGTVAIGGDQDIKCTFTNTRKRGSIELRKTLVPSADAGRFNLLIAQGAGGAGGSVDTESNAGDGGTTGANAVNTGTYNVSESGGTAPATSLSDYVVTGPVCVDTANGNASITVNGSGDLTVGANQVVVCTITNTRKPKVELVKVWSGTAGKVTLKIGTTTGGTELASTPLDGVGGTTGKKTAAAGTAYSFTETFNSPTVGTDYTSKVTCVNNGTGTSPTLPSNTDYTGSFSVTPNAGNDIVCTITNTRKQGKIQLLKDFVGGDGAVTLKIGTSQGGSETTSAALTADGATDEKTVNTGGYFVSESLTNATDYTAALACYNDVDDSDTVTGADTTHTVNTSTGAVSVGHLEDVLCVFTNTKKARVQVIKTVNRQVPSGTQAFTFQLREGATSVANGTVLETKIANAANAGTFTFDTKLVPGTYQLCETLMPGWSTTIGTLVPSQFIPPDGVAINPNVDNSTVCGNFTVAAGETKTFTIDNSPPPGGRALTIGFWKNWASCASSKGGGQKPVLDQTLAASEPTGILIGDLLLHGSTATPNVAPDCLKAVRILDKSTINNAKKMASDPAFNLAAQLLAAKLNVVAGAGVSTCAAQAINQAQALLDQVDFNGITHSTLTSAQAALMNSLATTLDRYNNNLLVCT